MAWQKIGVPSSSETWDLKKAKVGDSVEGKFAGKQESIGPNKSTIYQIEKEDGSIIGVWGTALLNYQLQNIKSGTKVKIVYQGMDKSPKTNRTFHNFDVYQEEPEDIPTIEDNERMGA